MKSIPRIQSCLPNNAKRGGQTPQAATLQPHGGHQNRNPGKVRFPNEPNLTSDNYGAWQPRNEIRKKMFSPNEPNSTPHRHGARGRPICQRILSRANPLDTLMAYVSNPRRPASPSSPSGDQSAAAP